MKKVTIIGVGTGRSTLTAEAQAALLDAELILGAPRLTEEFSDLGKPVKPVYMPDAVLNAVIESGCGHAAVLMSGDVGFYSGAAGLLAALEGFSVRLLPGISSVSAFFARLGLPWQDAKLVSAHGIDADVVGPVRRNRHTFCLTGGNTAQIASALHCAGFGELKIYVGENLGRAGERVTETTAAALMNAAPAPLTVLLIENGAPDARTPAGIPDESFLRGSKVPMTKSEVRAVIGSRLRLRPGDVCWDIGAGTGSVTVEMALAAYRGHVFAVEKNPGAARLIHENCAAFHVGNYTVAEGLAPEAAEALPAPDAVFIGGSTGKIGEIIALAVGKNPSVRVVASAIAVESTYHALKAMEAAGLSEVEAVQLGVARAKAAGGLHLMTAQNPITIISGGGR